MGMVQKKENLQSEVPSTNLRGAVFYGNHGNRRGCYSVWPQSNTDAIVFGLKAWKEKHFLYTKPLFSSHFSQIQGIFGKDVRYNGV